MPERKPQPLGTFGGGDEPPPFFSGSTTSPRLRRGRGAYELLAGDESTHVSNDADLVDRLASFERDPSVATFLAIVEALEAPDPPD